jgi:Na+/proline symporter
VSYVLELLIQLFAFGYALLLPGTLLALFVEAEWGWPVRLAVGLMVGLLVMPMACFAAAWLVGTSVTRPLVLLVATAVNVVAGALLLFLRERRRRAAAETR